WVRVGGAPGIGKNLEASASGWDQLTVFGLFFFLALAWWIAAATAGRGPRLVRWAVVVAASLLLAWLAVRRPDWFLACGVVLFLVAFFALSETRDDRLALGFVASAFFLVLFCQRLYIYDRMNTFFKLYLEAWLLFAIATAVLVFRARERRGAIDGWILPARAGAVVLAIAGLFTTATAGRAAVSRHFAPYSGPSLDGLRYLEQLHPGEYRAVVWLRRTVEGTPVLLEAQGPSYQDFGRISMLTGLPTVLGWDYHVKQRGNSETEIETRRLAVKAIYSETDASRVAPFLKRYGVGYVYVGWLERKTYPVAGLQKFRTEKTLFELAYENPETQIYRVVGGPAQDVLLPAKETLPESAAAAGEPQDEPEEKPSILEKADASEPPFANLREPRGVAVDARGRVWVADFGHSRLRIFDAEGGPLGGWGGRGSGEFGFKELCGVAIDGDALYVADTWNGRIQGYTIGGLLRASVGELYGPRGVAVAPDGRVWVTDTGNHRVVSYDPLLQDPKSFGKRGTAAGEFTSPVGIAVAPSGLVYVADAGNRRIQVLSASGDLVGSLPFAGWAGSAEPGLAVDKDGTIYATDPGTAAVVALDPSGVVKRRIVVDDAGRKFENPTGIAVDRKNRILYVVNSGNASVAKVSLSDRRTP
ncbi:MAG TPA: SMP-30/gluconolactonase/LRE family protein, partial [Thermoanaerobaculia bacterium]|nr:SMP-30/gluconolactonase/LRE family protein [Thermoanaerobaculia bacterium]